MAVVRDISDRIVTLFNYVISLTLCALSISATESHVSFFDNEQWHAYQYNLLFRLNGLRIPLITEYLSKGKSSKSKTPLEKIRIIDVGSGGGFVAEPLAKLGARITGIDANEVCVNYCRNRLDGVALDLRHNLDYFNGYLEDYSTDERAASLDAIVASEVLEHVPDVDSVIRSCSKLLKPNGKLFITTINKTLYAYLTAIVLPEKIFRYIDPGTHQYSMLVPLDTLKTIMKRHGFRIMYLRGFNLDLLRRDWSWRATTDAWYAIVAEKVV